MTPVHHSIDWLTAQDSAWWAAVGTWATAVVAIVASGFAFFQVREARKSREAMAQPFIVVSLEPSPEASNLINLRVENIGQTLARDVVIKFDPPLTPVRPGDWDLDKGTLLTEGIRSMPPRMKVERIFDNTIEWGEDGANQTVWAYDVTVTFKDHTGKNQDPLDYRIDLRHLMTGTYIESRNIHHLAQAVEGIRDEVKKWTEGSSKGLRVVARDGDELDRARREAMEARRAVRAREANPSGSEQSHD